MRKTVCLVVFLLSVVGLLAADDPKVFIDSERYASTHTGILTGHVSSNASIISSPEIATRFSLVCPECRVTIKKDASDYVVSFAKAEGGEVYSWAVYENKEGMLLRTGQTIVFNTAIKEAAQLVRLHWNNQELPTTGELKESEGKPMRVVFYRAEGMNSSSTNPTFFCDGKEIGKLTKKKFFIFNIPADPPPQFKVHVARADNPFKVIGRSGETVYMKYKSPGAFSPGSKIEQVDEATAKEDLAKLSAEDAKNISDTRVVLSLN